MIRIVARPVIAIVVTPECIAGVTMIHGNVTREHTLACGDSPSAIVTQIGELVRLLHTRHPKAAGPRGLAFFDGWMLPSVKIALAPPYGRLKKIENLPMTKSQRVLMDLIRESGDRLFIRQEQGVLVADHVDGESWVALYDRNIIECLQTYARNTRTSIEFVTSIAALRSWTQLSTKLQNDGDNNGAISPSTSALAHALARTTSVPTASWKRKPSGVSQWLGGYGRTQFISFLIAASVVVGTFGPSILQSSRLRRKEALLASSHLAQKLYADSANKLKAVSGTLNGIAEFQARRRSVTQMLASLSEALPENVVVEQLRADSVGGTLTIAGPGASRAAFALEHYPAFANIELTSPIQWIDAAASSGTNRASENSDAEPNARVSIRFRYGKPSAASMAQVGGH